MSTENNPAPELFGRVHPYGADQPAAIGAGLNSNIRSPVDESLFVGMVTDCSTHSHSCTVTVPLKTAGFGVPCVWLASGINRFGGCSDFCPPEVGSTVFVYLMKGSNFGVVLGQVPSLIEDPELPGGGMIDPLQAITAFNENTGQVMKDMQIGGSALNAYQKQPNDAFPGDKGFGNELGVGLGILRTISYLKASDLAKIEAFLIDDLLRIVGKNLDVFTGAGDVLVRDEMGYLTTELYHAMTHWESLGSLKEGEDPKSGPIWRLRTIIGHHGDLKRQFVSFPMLAMEPDGTETVVHAGVAERLDSSDGLVVERSIVGGGLLKSRQVAVPERVRNPEWIGGSDDNPRPPLDPEDLSDFFWQYNKHGDITPQMRDAMAWIMGRQTTARLKPYDQGGENPDWALQDESQVGLDKGNPGASTGTGGHFREILDPITIETNDPTGNTKPRVVRINDCWIFILPDGSVTIRDGLASVVTLTRGHIDISASKDVNITAGRNVNVKAGNDINLNARNSIDVTAGQGQARIFARKSTFIHSEMGGIMLSTNSPGGKSDPEKDVGEGFEVSGILLKPHYGSDVVIETRSVYVQASNNFFVGGRPGIPGERPGSTPNVYFEARQMMHNVGQAHWQLGGSKYVQFVGGDTTIDTDGNINTEANVYALFGTMKMNSSLEQHENNDFCNVPGSRYQILVDRLEPLYKNLVATGQRSKAKRNPARQRCGVDRDDSDASNRNVLNWGQLHSSYGRLEISLIAFSLRTEADYQTDTDDFSWTEQPWMREWSLSEPWGKDAHTTTKYGQTWCYPGKKYWTGNKGVKFYTEANVDPNGDPKKREELLKEGGTFHDDNFQKMRRHPDNVLNALYTGL